VAPPFSQLWLYSGASMPRSLIRSPFSVMVSPSLITASPEIFLVSTRSSRAATMARSARIAAARA
jgi:hypothetical protein